MNRPIVHNRYTNSCGIKISLEGAIRKNVYNGSWTIMKKGLRNIDVAYFSQEAEHSEHKGPRKSFSLLWSSVLREVK